MTRCARHPHPSGPLARRDGAPPFPCGVARPPRSARTLTPGKILPRSARSLSSNPQLLSKTRRPKWLVLNRPEVAGFEVTGDNPADARLLARPSPAVFPGRGGLAQVQAAPRARTTPAGTAPGLHPGVQSHRACLGRNPRERIREPVLRRPCRCRSSSRNRAAPPPQRSATPAETHLLPLDPNGVIIYLIATWCELTHSASEPAPAVPAHQLRSPRRRRDRAPVPGAFPLRPHHFRWDRCHHWGRRCGGGPPRPPSQGSCGNMIWAVCQRYRRQFSHSWPWELSTEKLRTPWSAKTARVRMLLR